MIKYIQQPAEGLVWYTDNQVIFLLASIVIVIIVWIFLWWKYK